MTTTRTAGSVASRAQVSNPCVVLLNEGNPACQRYVNINKLMNKKELTLPTKQNGSCLMKSNQRRSRVQGSAGLLPCRCDIRTRYP